MSEYTTPEFLNDGSVNHNYEDLSYHEKLKIRALEGLDNLAANLNAIANIKAIEFQINHLNDTSDAFTAQLAEKDAQIASLQDQIDNFDTSGLENQITLLQGQITTLSTANSTLQENFNKLKSVLTSIDQMTDEVID